MKSTNLKSASLLFVLLFMASTGFSQSETDYKTKIQALNKEMAKCMVEGNSEKAMSMYTADAISMPSYEPMHEGLEAIRAANDAMLKTGSRINSFELDTRKVIPNGNLITEIGTYKINISMPAMDKPIDDHGKYLTVWEKQKDGSLKVKIETWNSDVDPMAVMKQTEQKAMVK